MKQLFESIKLQMRLTYQWILTKLGPKKSVEIDWPTPTPEEERDNAIKAYAEGLKENFNAQLETLLSDEDFLRFATESYQQRGIEDSIYLTEENIRNFYDELAEEYAKMFWYLSNVSGILPHKFSADNQDIINRDGKVPVNAYGLCYSNTEKGLTLEVKQSTVEAKAITFPFMDFTKFVFAPHILDVKKALVENTFGHIVEQLLEEIVSNAPEEILDTKQSHELDEHIIQMCEINIIANRIAMNSVRGAGNVIIVPSNQIEQLLTFFNEANSKGVPVTIEDHFKSLDFESEYLKYLFTVNGIKVFSSPLLKQKIETRKPDSDLNSVMLWAGSASTVASDAPTTIVIAELANWIPWKTISVDDLSASFLGHRYTWKDIKDKDVVLYKVRDTFSVVATDNEFGTCKTPHGRALLTQLRSLKENNND